VVKYIVYYSDLAKLVESHGLNMYIDDTQVYGFSPPSLVDPLQIRMLACIDDVAGWMLSNRLQLNAAKTEILWCSSTRRQSQLPTTPFHACSDHVTPSTVVRNLGIFLDSDVNMRVQVSRTISRCFQTLRQLHSIRHSVPRSVFQSLIAALVLTSSISGTLH